MPDSEYQLNVMDDPRLPFIIKNGSTNLRNSVPNWHENTEILLCSAGAGYFLCGETQYAVMPGDIVVANSEMLHCAYTDDYMEYHYLNIDRHFCLENGIPTTNLTFREFVQDAELSRRFLLKKKKKKAVCANRKLLRSGSNSVCCAGFSVFAVQGAYRATNAVGNTSPG